jgi:hypothetical protein
MLFKRQTLLALSVLALSHGAFAQTDATIDAAAPDTNTSAAATPDKRIFGVLPNYRTVENSTPFSAISTRQKFTIATKDTVDGPSYALAGLFAGISQLNNGNPSFGQGMEGYARRYASAIADQDIGNFMTEAIMPTLLREDPRYFRRGTGSIKGRIAYAASRVTVAKTDKGTPTFNFAEFLGNGVTASVGNLYYPDAIGFAPTMQRMFTQIGTDALSNVLKEFWPDVKKKFLNRHHS